jgi:hypothetical protein
MTVEEKCSPWVCAKELEEGTKGVPRLAVVGAEQSSAGNKNENGACPSDL